MIFGMQVHHMSPNKRSTAAPCAK